MENKDQERRLYFHKLFKAIPGVTEVYYQPPSSIQMHYPCIVYSWDRNYDKRADDILYSSRRGYSLTIIDSNPDSIIPGIFQRNFQQASFERHYVANNLHHWVYNIYF